MARLLPIRNMPNWLATFNKNSLFNINDVLTDSIYYPASATDGFILKKLTGAAHSFIYVDPYVNVNWLIEDLHRIGGYNLIFSTHILREQLCFKPYRPIYPIPNIDGLPDGRMSGENINPYAYFSILERKERADPNHGPKRFSILFIAGEGVATFQSLYLSNQIKPYAIVLKGNIGFAGNWTVFQRRNGILERSVMANPAGFPDYLITDRVYGSPNYFDFETTWDNYQTLYKETTKHGLIRVFSATKTM